MGQSLSSGPYSICWVCRGQRGPKPSNDSLRKAAQSEDGGGCSRCRRHLCCRGWWVGQRHEPGGKA